MPTKKPSLVKNSPPKASHLGGLWHHAYFIESSPEIALPALLKKLEAELNQPTRGHPDIFLHRSTVFSIEDSRQVKAESSGRPIVGKSKFIILAAEFFAPEAQHALLKTLEDASPNTHYFLITPQTEKLLPTLRSRLEKIELKSEKSDFKGSPKSDFGGQSVAGGFLALSLPERLAFVGKLIERHKDDEDSGLLKKEASELLNSLEIILHKNLHNTSRDARDVCARGLEEIIRARDYLSDRGAMTKMILENLALTL